MNEIIRVQELCRTYHMGHRKVPALQNVTLTVRAGQVIVLRGRSGSGKTTLLNCIGGLDRPTSGRIWLGNDEITQMSEARLVHVRRHQIGFVFQSHALLPTYSAFENVDLMLRLTNTPHQERHERTKEILRLVGLGKWMNHRPYELSGGQQQRVAIARAIAPNPKVILADEPTGELDSATGQQVLRLFRQIADDEGTTFLIATHDLTVDTLADTVFHLQDGRVAVP
ncbi:MAG: ABC transporter ATP-binding protein [Chloroflexi bacterium]|nr:MAG: ABC transporter ATP-binding protein [Chloroflexota bacterium]